VDLVEDVDFDVARRTQVDLGQQVAHVVDAVVRRGIEFVEIERPALFDGDTALTLATGLGIVTEVGAVERLREHASRRRLPGAARAVEHVGMADFTLRHRVLQRRDDVLLTADFGELLRAISAVERLVGHARLTLGADRTRRRPFPGVAARRSAAHRQLR